MGATEAELAPRSADITSAFVPFLAVAVVVVSVASAPAGWPYAIPLIVPVALFFVWTRRDIPALPLTLAVVAAVALSQLSGELEPALFLLSLLALVITGWTELGPGSVTSVVLVLAAPPALSILWPDSQIAWGIWIGGIAFPAFMGWAFHRQEALSADLEQARRDLAEQAVSEERRRIARDVHDLVGHGLAAMMLQVTSARHVLRRDADAADEALEAAEEVGRQSMGELRRTVSLLRDGDSATAAPPPGISQLGALVDSARAGGLRVDHDAYGDHDRVDTVQGLAVYRVVQESLSNASRHAPRAATVVTTTVTDVEVELSVVTSGPVQPQDADADRPRYGLRGMRERIDAVGGGFSAGPTSDGWAVHCTVPLAAGETAALGSSAVGR
ncbi:MAG: histidine kinase [Nocardioidaceae bacterium]